MTSRDERLSFLTWALGPRPTRDAVLYGCSNTPPPSGGAPATWKQGPVESVGALAARLDARTGEAEVYARLAWFASGLKATADAVIARRLLSGDLDAKALPGATETERLQRAIDLARTMPVPCVIIGTGGGVHVHVLLPERQRFETFADLADARRTHSVLGRALRLYFEDRAHEAYGVRVSFDHTHGVERAWRVPPGSNMKAADGAKALTADPSRWRDVRLLYPSNPEGLASVTPADLRFLAPFLDAAEAEEDDGPAAATGSPSTPPHPAAPFEVSLLPRGMCDRWPMPDGDQSEHDFAVACALLEAGSADDTIANAIRGRRGLLHDPVVRAKGERPDYIAMTIAKARAATAQRVAASPKKSSPPSCAAPFPMDALPRAIREYVDASARAIGCDVGAVATPMLVALAGAIGNSRRIALKPEWAEPSVLWATVVGESGSLKSPAFESAIGPMKRHEGRLARGHSDLLRRYDADMERFERDRALWRKGKGGQEPPVRPQRPALPRVLISDTTIEAVAEVHEWNPRGLLLARDELSGWMRSFDAYRAGRGGDAAKWLEMYRASLVLVDRKSGDRRTIRVPRAAVSIVGTIQPDALRRALGVEHFEDGMAARFLLAMPAGRPRRWSEVSVPSQVSTRVEHAFEALLGLSAEKSPDGDLIPVDLGLAPEAKAAWVVYVNAHGAEGDGLAGADSAAWAKAEGAAARLALIVHLARWAAEDPTVRPRAVDLESLAAGITLSRWFEVEARRVYGVLRESETARDRRRLVEWVRTRDGRATVRDLVRCGPRDLRTDAAVAEKALGDLVGRGWGAWEEVPTTASGGRPTRAFVLHVTPALTGDGDETLAGPDASAVREAPTAAASEAIPAFDPPEVVSPSPTATGWTLTPGEEG